MTRSIGIVDRMRWMTVLAGAVLLACLGAAFAAQRGQLPSASTVSGPAPVGSSAPLDPRIAAIAARHPDQLVEAIVQFRPGVGLEQARWDVDRAAGDVFGELHIINALAVRLTAARARWLSSNGDVHAISLNGEVRTQSGLAARAQNERDRKGVDIRDLQTTYDQTVGAVGLWRNGATGEGVGVAVVDTGIDGFLPDFQGPGGASRVVVSAVTNPAARTAIDSYGHGTDVAGIIAGNGDNLSPSDPLAGQYIGVAPRANLISIKASDEAGKATVLDVIYGLQFAVDHRADYNIRVVNLSLNARTPQSYKTDPLDAAAESAWMHGIIVVAAAGNNGAAEDAVQYAPANDPYVITVGAVDENGTAGPSDDVIPDWSSRGTTQDGFQKPDVYAPGAHIVSVLAPFSAFSRICQTCLIGGHYIRTSGTSMATAVISGVVADLLQLHPDWTPDQVKGALTSPGASSNPSFQEVDTSRAATLGAVPVADRGLTPNRLVDNATGTIDYSQSSWSQSRWSQATGTLSAGFAQSSWSCSCGGAAADSVGPSQSSWSTSSWSTSSWSTYFDHTTTAG